MHGPLPTGYASRTYQGDEDHAAIATLRAGCAARDGIDSRSIVEGVPTAAQIARFSASLDDPTEDQILVVRGADVVGHTAVTRWQESDGTWVYLHLGHVLPGHRGLGIGSAMLTWAEEHIRALVRRHGTAATAVFGANAAASATEATALLLEAGYRQAFRLMELEFPDLRRLTAPGPPPPPGITLAAVEPHHHRAAWQVVVDSYAHNPFVEPWSYQGFRAELAKPGRRYAAWDGERMAGVVLCSLRPPDHSPAVIEELCVRAEWRRLGVGRALLLEGLRGLRAQGASSARLTTSTTNPHRSYDLYESVGFQRRNEHIRYRRPFDAGGGV
ncbi:ribosomal protein S18 acetylase RimI-like enzyme [Nonomuraea fuscirosea]|uniref:Ribosomal protein S18 acetylase RimI-like enzyme n=1 Tax=Nonomuraea fuscirosea TaxID=1291556 RepID=A0A2T0MZS3_9ACTN|nr:GNAT family N-acetyltransferase [Nonomuraea fuscirosea]PRX64895.1 ribosomal protein S18 acetylase RimI-like enzyme [Nonomuraea fuscirosea]